MKIAILETGVPPPGFATTHGRYDAMIATMLGDRHAYRTYDVVAGDYPTDALAYDAYAITGSAAGVHDGDAWIDTLSAFLREIRGKAKIIGICFGHQIIAQAFGGHVARSRRGWGLGLHSYAVVARFAWMDDADIIAIPASHQDQVITPPPGASIIASSNFTPCAALAFDDGSALSFQPHPEFTVAFASAVIGRDGDERVPVHAQDAARASLAAPNDSKRVARWINAYLAG